MFQYSPLYGGAGRIGLASGALGGLGAYRPYGAAVGVGTAERHKAFVCGVCGVRFPQGWQLRRHEVTHTDERNFHCPFCDSSFKLAQNVKRHIKAKHPVPDGGPIAGVASRQIPQSEQVPVV